MSGPAMASATERKFTALRKRLDQLGYRQSVGIESLPLVEKLFGDLLHTTESLKKAKLQLNKQSEQKGVWEQQVEPYRLDNARLVRENNELHQKVLKLKESSEIKVRDLKATLRRLDHENTDLKFLNTQYVQKIQSTERESQAKTDRIIELQEKNLDAIIQTPGGRKKKIPSRRQRMDVESLLPESHLVPSGDVLILKPVAEPDPYVADLLKTADLRIGQLQETVANLERDGEEAERRIVSLKKQIDSRDAEIERLNVQLTGGRPPEVLAIEGKKDSNEKMVAHLNVQIDFLQQANHTLEEKLTIAEASSRKVEGECSELRAKNASICAELQSISELVRQMEKEKATQLADAEQQLLAQEAKYSELVQKLNNSEDVVKTLEQEKLVLVEDNRRMAQMLCVSKGDEQMTTTTVKQLMEEKRSLQEQCNLLKKREAQLEQHMHNSSKVQGVVSEPQDYAELKAERNELREAVKNFETELMQIQMDAQDLASDRNNFKVLYEQTSEEVTRLRSQLKSTPASASLMRRLEGERDDARMEVRQLKSECNSLQTRLKATRESQQSDVTTLDDQLRKSQLEVDQLAEENRTLQERVTSLREMVRRLEGEIKSSTAALSNSEGESYKYKNKVAQLQAIVDSQELQKEQHQRGLQAHTTRAQESQAQFASLQAKLAEVKREDEKQKEQMAQLKLVLTNLDKERDSLQEEVDQKADKISDIENLLTQQENEKAELEKEIQQLRSQQEQYLTDKNSKDRQVLGLQSQLDSLKGHLQDASGAKSAYEQEIQRLKGDLNTMTQENQAVHEELRTAVEEREMLRQKLQEHIQTMMTYEEAVTSKEQEKGVLLTSYRAMADENERLSSSVQQSVEESTSVKLQLAGITQEKHQLQQILEQQQLEIEQYSYSMQSYEIQLSNLTTALSKMEQTIRKEQEEKRALLADLTAMRELCVQLDKAKDTHSRQVATVSSELEQLQGQMADLQGEKVALETQLAAEKAGNHGLETLLATERKKEYHSHVSGQEKELELRHLKEQLERLEASQTSCSEQLKIEQARAKQRSHELEQLKAELAAEKFQRERSKQEVQRLRQMLSTSLSSSVDQETSSQNNKIPTDTMDVEKTITKERESLANESARVISELLSASGSSTGSQHSSRTSRKS
ncbi:centrosomal protein of 135 kDa-like [Dysidea avara]|uniref:centrosomal protein of 135 kDa-like n=1 Tax=Dysidea avara TaxID=196820 RepID=UPI003331EADC